jgi:hypothetical protein
VTHEILHIEPADCLPTVRAVLEMQGVPAHAKLDDRTGDIAREAIKLFETMAKPRAIMTEIERAAFDPLFEGEGRNDDESPVKPIAQRSDRLALFALTIGEEICSQITRFFKEGEYPLGAMLDSAASVGTDLAAGVLEARYRARLHSGAARSKRGTLRFSPGYCGWHVSGQKKLFKALEPGAIGISLNDSCLMQPLKSISGVMIAGPKDIFEFDDVFSFCRDCADHTCRQRLRELAEQ